MSKFVFLFASLLITFSGSASRGASLKKAPAPVPIRFTYAIELQTGLDSRRNPNGLTTNDGFGSFYSDLRWKAKYWQLVTRPMLLHLQTQNAKDKSTHTDFKEIYGVWVPTGDFSISLGRQKFEWGPTEFYNVSNPFVVINPVETFARRFVLPPVILKISQSFATSWNLTAIANLENTTEERGTQSQVKDSAYTIKLEDSAPNGDFVFGTTYGKGQITPPFLGFYGRWSHSSGFSIYTDLKESWGSAVYYPVVKTNTPFKIIELQDSEFNSRQTFLMYNLGLRLESSWDLRLEYLANKSGYNSEQMQNFPYAFAPYNSYRSHNQEHLTHLHLDFLRQNYLYFSSRSPQFGFQKKYLVSFQVIANHDDRSWIGTTKLERQIGDNGTLVLAASQTEGDPTTGEFSNAVKNYFSVFFKWVL